MLEGRRPLRPEWPLAGAAAVLWFVREFAWVDLPVGAMIWVGRHAGVLQTLLVLLVVWRVALRVPRVHAWAERAIVAEATSPSPAASSWRPWGLVGLAATLAGLGLVASMRPGYFVQDDNYWQFLPVITHGCRSLFAGVFPEWNPHQLLGAPTASVGTYALTYPGTWASYAVARGLLGDENRTVDVFCHAHLALGYLATFRCARAVGLRAPLAAATGVAFALCGFLLILGRTWFYMAPVALWAPLLVGQVEALRRGEGGARWALATGLAVGAFFHAGNAQMWAYTMLFVVGGGALLGAAGDIPRARWREGLAALLVGLAVAAPLLVPQLLFTRDIHRVGGTGQVLTEGLVALFVPHPIFPGLRVNTLGSTADDLTFMRQLYYAGTVLTACWAAVALTLPLTRWSRRLVADNLWSLAAALALVLGLGRAGYLWTLLCAVPLFDKFQGAFKLLAYVTLFSLLGGGLALERTLRREGRSAELVAAVVMALMLWHCAFARASEYSQPDRAYPPLPEGLRAPLTAVGPGGPARFVSVSPDRSVAPGFHRSLHVNFATAYGAYGVDGFDPLVWARPESRVVYRHTVDDWFAAHYLGGDRPTADPAYDPLPGLRAYGVRWVVVHRTAYEPARGRNPFFAAFEGMDEGAVRQRDRLVAASRPVFTAPDVTLRELPSPDALAHAAGSPTVALPLTLDASGAVVDVRGVVGDVVVSLLLRPRLTFALDGRPVSARADRWGRAVVRAPAGARTLRVRYRAEWGKGLALSAAAALGALAVMRGRRRAVDG